MLLFSDSYDIAQIGHAPSQRYDDDLLLANWNPVLELLVTFRGDDADDGTHDAGRDLIAAADEGFLDRVYVYATHI